LSFIEGLKMTPKRITLIAALIGVAVFAYLLWNRGTKVEGPLSSPKAAFNTHIKALYSKDVKTYLGTLAKSSLQALEERAKQQSMSVEDYEERSMQMLEAALYQRTRKPLEQNYLAPKFGDELHDAGEVQLKYRYDDSAKWSTAYLIKEGADWKVDREKEVD
jgi:hypothetical protein